MTIAVGQIWAIPHTRVRWLVLSVGCDFAWVFWLGSIPVPEDDARTMVALKSFSNFHLESDVNHEFQD